MDYLCDFWPNDDPKICTSGKVPNSFKTVFRNNTPSKLAISLSGGVDSMVSSWIVRQILKDCELHCIHINYNNRNTCKDEITFLQWWCDKINVKLHLYHMPLVRETYMKSNRNFYENETRRMRFDAYTELQCPVILGHNFDDIVENVMTNIASNKHSDFLCGMSEISIINGVTLYRPMLNVSKNDIISYAKRTNIPYLQDSTPSWSRRGQLRDILIPVLNSVEPLFLKNLVKFCKSKQVVKCNVGNV